MNRLIIVSICLTASPPSSTAADDAKLLTIGDKAPPIDIAHWIKGEPLTGFEAGRVYVLEFWATWCGPCVGGMPHLSELQEKYAKRGMRIVGVSDEPPETVRAFLRKSDARDKKPHDQRTRYTLASDPDRSVYDAYMKAAGMDGIPTAFVIGKSGLIEWIGHPIRMDNALDAVVSGTWDREKHKAATAAKQALNTKIAAVRKRFQQAAEREDWEAAVKALSERLALEPTDAPSQVTKYFYLADKLNAPDRALTFVRELIESRWHDADTLNDWAWRICGGDTRIKKTDNDLALKAALRANELTRGTDASVLDTLAMVYHRRGELKKAVAWQRKAVEEAGKESPFGKELAERLDEYVVAAKNANRP